MYPYNNKDDVHTPHQNDIIRDKHNVCANVFVKKNASDNIKYHSSV